MCLIWATQIEEAQKEDMAIGKSEIGTKSDA